MISTTAVSSSVFYVSPSGCDSWSGRLPEPAETGADGPFATVQRARDVLRTLYSRGRLTQPATVYLRDGVYPLNAPLVFGPQDSAPVAYAAYEGETPVLDGGRRITGWAPTQVNGMCAWVADLPEVRAGEWYFSSLYVNGERRSRPRLPRKGLYRIADVPGLKLPGGWGEKGNSQFRLGDGEMKRWRNLTDVEIVAFHFWIDERLPVAAFDETTGVITSARTSYAPLVEVTGGQFAPCFIENVFEALEQPGEWYLDRAAGRLYYIPLAGEDPVTTEVYAPRLLQLLRLEGDPDANNWVEWLRFEGLHFRTTDAVQPGPAVEELMPPALTTPGRRQNRRYRVNRASSCQGAADVPGVIYMRGARHCSIVDCCISNIGWYGIQMTDGCMANAIVGNEIRDAGAGGVWLDGAAFEEAACLRTGSNRITDNHIHECGRVFHSGIGILAMNTFDNVLSHNHIHDLYYSGISCGWVWGYSPCIARDNLIEKNHIHDLGHGLLSDMGGIYTLGVQPGTVLRGNLIHDVLKLNYGAWCIYPDEGSSHMLIENNVCYRTNAEIFHQHYGRENIVRNNIFAFGGNSVLAHSRADLQHKAFTMENNILLTDGKPIYLGLQAVVPELRNHRSDHNLMWDISDVPLRFGSCTQAAAHDLAAWQALGYDRHSVVDDPKFANPANGDFTLAPDSPAFALGFEPIDMSDVGPRPPSNR